MPSTIPVSELSAKLWTHGVELDGSREKFGWLTESQPSADVSVLHTRIQRDGYLFLRDFWRRERVQEVRDSLTIQLERLGFLQPGAPRDEARAIPDRTPGRATGNPLDQGNPVLRNLVFGDEIMAFFRRFLGGEPRHFDYIWFRTKGPGIGSPIHCDLVYMGRGTHHLYSAWVPLGDIDLQMGGLLILENSHTKTTELAHYLSRDVDTFCSNRDDAKAYASGEKWWDGTLSNNAVALQHKLGGRWLTAPEFRMGDMVIFTMTLVHGSLDNHSDRIRLSTDTRYQLASDPVDARWVGEKPAGHSAAMKRGRVC